ncbi:MAG: undecaprenyldiphospho-muramoylpentapeptide beta-N-acetylglucosaminyltransferase [Legionellales bacterium]|nr:undecaprenyldiphospho-muramoylpentapeptide beta-N-acetylglucosaminyltransferase [Legionellales bacterium]
MRKKNRIIFTGGGSAGHVVPCLPIIENFINSGCDVRYIGSYAGIECNIILKKKIPYIPIFTGKFRRYFSWENFLDPFKIVLGIFQSIVIIFKLKPSVIFSKGGFVAFPVVLAGWLNRVPIVIHESDITPGLANRWSFFFAKKICLTFANQDVGKKGKFIFTGTPIRDEILNGDANIGKNICRFSREQPVILFIGGGNGSQVINMLIENNYEDIISKFNVIQVTGISNKNTILTDRGSHIVFKYVQDELSHLFAYADCIVSRAGSNIIHEILAISKPHILIPLSKKISRGEQELNAKYFNKHYGSIILTEEQIDSKFIDVLYNTMNNIAEYKDDLLPFKCVSGNDKIISILSKYIN